MRLLVHGTGRSGTTLTQRIVNAHSSIWVTNEFLLYDLPFGYYERQGRKSTPAEDLFKSLSRKDAWVTQAEHAWQESPRFNEATFVEACINEYKTLMPIHGASIKSRIMAVESVMFGNDYLYFGDKLLESLALERLINIDMNYKLIYVFRDIRDVVAAKKFHKFELNKAYSYDMDCVIDHLTVQKALERLPSKNVLFLKYEDYATNVNLDKIVSFFPELSADQFRTAYKSIIDPDKLKIGWYKEIIPNWEDLLEMPAKKILTELNYI